jgi:predicted cupin superfamily sugar epimerase
VDIVGKKGIVNVGTVVFWLLRHNESSQYHSRR